MVDEPDVVKELREAEKLGMLQSKGQNSYKLLHVMEENTEDVFYEKSDFGEDYVEKRYHLIADITSDLICTTTFQINPTYIYVNPSYKRILGYTPDDMIGKPVWDFMHLDDKKNLLPLLKKYIGMKAALHNKYLHFLLMTCFAHLLKSRFMSFSKYS
jgi:PAS domain-containing protein